jgi:CheY-like chemotaxis protein
VNTILLIEDNVNNAALLQDIFELDDIPARLVSVETGEEALNRAVTLQPVLILMDLRLPGSTVWKPPRSSNATR